MSFTAKINITDRNGRKLDTRVASRATTPSRHCATRGQSTQR